MSSIRINGNEITIENGSSVSIINGTIHVNGKSFAQFGGENIAKLVVDGDITVEQCNGNMEVKGNVASKNGLSVDGNLTCGNITGDVKSDGNVICGKITGTVKCNGNIIGGR